MMARITILIILLAALPAGVALGASGKYPHNPCTPKSRLPGCRLKSLSTETLHYAPKTYQDHGLQDTMTEAGRRAKGFYITAYSFPRFGAARIARMMKKALMNAVVIDMKDDLGYVTYPSQIPLTRGLQQKLIKDPAAAVRIFHENGIYVIGRVVCFKDSRLPYLRPDLAVRSGPRAQRMLSAGANWIDAYAQEVQDYLIDIALEIHSFGFDEVQFDYIRFPKGYAGKVGRWLHQDGRDHATLITEFLEKVDRALPVPISVDIYGLTTLVDGDPRLLGQSIEMLARHADAISPMMYANGMRTYFKENKVTQRVYSYIHCGLWRARNKAPQVVLRPFLQAYPLGVEDFFGTQFIKQQIFAAERAGSNGFLFWNAGMKNGVAYSALQQLGAKRLEQYGMSIDKHLQATSSPGPWCPQQGAVFGGDKPEPSPTLAHRAHFSRP